MSNFILNKNQINNVVLTLSERSHIVDPFYLIVFTNKFDTSEVTAVCSLQNGVLTNIRYDLLTIEEKTNPNALNGEVHLIEGEWSYNVYESVQQTLLISETTNRVLQKGFLIVK